MDGFFEVAELVLEVIELGFEFGELMCGGLGWWVLVDGVVELGCVGVGVDCSGLDLVVVCEVGEYVGNVGV